LYHSDDECVFCAGPAHYIVQVAGAVFQWGQARCVTCFKCYEILHAITGGQAQRSNYGLGATKKEMKQGRKEAERIIRGIEERKW
jgi:hypothetical protein